MAGPKTALTAASHPEIGRGIWRACLRGRARYRVDGKIGTDSTTWPSRPYPAVGNGLLMEGLGQNFRSDGRGLSDCARTKVAV